MWAVASVSTYYRLAVQLTSHLRSPTHIDDVPPSAAHLALRQPLLAHASHRKRRQPASPRENRSAYWAGMRLINKHAIIILIINLLISNVSNWVIKWNYQNVLQTWSYATKIAARLRPAIALYRSGTRVPISSGDDYHICKLICDISWVGLLFHV